LTFGHVVYGVHLGNLLAIGVVLGVLGICTTAIGLLFAVAVRSDNQAIAFTQILALGGAALGGLWFPIDMMPHGLQIVGHFTPQYWAQQGLQDIMLRGADVADVWPSLAAIAGFAALAATLALMRFRRFLHDAVTHQNVG
jgi:ABC-2 type transport system permease protein